MQLTRVSPSFRDADFIFSTLMEFERACMLAVPATDAAKAQASFLATVVSKFTTEAFHTLRRYLQTTGEIKSLTALLMKAQRFSDAGIAMAITALKAEDFREKQGMLSVSNGKCLFLLNNTHCLRPDHSFHCRRPQTFLASGKRRLFTKRQQTII